MMKFIMPSNVNNMSIEVLIEHYRNIAPSTIGHLTTVGYLNGIQAQCQNIKMVGKVVTVKIYPPDASAIRDALIASQAGDVLVIECVDNNHYACWGELRNLAAQVKGLAGVVIAGPATDIKSIREQAFPVFATGVSAVTTHKQTNVEHQSPAIINSLICISGTTIQAGDIAIGDDDGVFILSPAAAFELLPFVQNKEQQDHDKKQVLLQKLVKKH